MLWLACDTSTSRGSLALFENSTLLQNLEWEQNSSHSEFITLSFQKILSTQKVSARDIQFLAVGAGPGSFTGVRVAINFVRAIGYSLKIPVVNLNSLHLLALQTSLLSLGLTARLKSGVSVSPVCVLQYAFRNLAYAAVYEITDTVKEVLSPRALTPDEISNLINKKTLVIGTGYKKLQSQFSEVTQSQMVRDGAVSDYPSATNFVSLFNLDQYRGYLTDWIHTIPLYVRASEAEEKLRMGLLKPL